MHVLFDARLLHRGLSGLERVQRNLLRALARRSDLRRLRAVVHRGTELGPGMPDVERLEVGGSDELLAALLSPDPALRPDVYHLSWFPDRNPREVWLPQIVPSCIVEMHDAILNRHPEYHPSRAGFDWYNGFVHRLLQGADRVLVHSEAVARDAERMFSVPADRIDRAPLAVDPELAEPLPDAEAAALRAELGLPPSYFAMVGKDYPHKDHATALRALALLRRSGVDGRILCAGARVWHRSGETSDEVVAREGIAGHVRWIEGLDDRAIKALLQGSRALIYPSREEGFGLPPLEAMALGVPVVTTKATSIPEVCGDAPIYVPVGDPRALAREMRRLLEDPDHAAAHARRGRTRAADFSWDAAARAVVASYQRARRARQAPRLDRQLLDLWRSTAECPFSDAAELAAWRDRCLSREYQLEQTTAQRDRILAELQELQRRDGLPVTELPRAAQRPRWSLKRRLKKIRDGLRRKRG
jgi:glycosyltransferase involved in cell wall biosynthesis